MRGIKLTATLCAVLAMLIAATARPQTPYAEPAGPTRSPLQTALAQRDSASAAWAVAQHRIAVLEAQAARDAAQDSTQVASLNAWWQSRLDDQRAEVKRAMLVSAGTAATCILIFLAASSR